MQSSPTPLPVSKSAFWIGWVLGLLPALLIVFSAVVKFLKPPGFAEGFAHAGWPVTLANPLGIVEIVCALLYLVPKTAVLGAILLTGYMGGAIATGVRIGDPYYPQFLIGVALWGGLYLRDPRVRALIPLRS